MWFGFPATAALMCLLSTVFFKSTSAEMSVNTSFAHTQMTAQMHDVPKSNYKIESKYIFLSMCLFNFQQEVSSCFIGLRNRLLKSKLSTEDIIAFIS